MARFLSYVMALSLVAAGPLLSAVRGPESGKEILTETSGPRQGPFVAAAKKATPAVVLILAEGIADSSGREPFEFFHNDDFFRRFFGMPPGQPNPGSGPSRVGQGSGFIISPDGHILTNYHVVRMAKKITVLLHSGTKRKLPATYIGGDERTDVAVLKIDKEEGKDYPYLTFADSDAVEVGQWVLAVGSPMHLEATVTAGIIGAKGRQGLEITDLEDFLQTDAAINQGNSGGPLVDLEGQVVGMNTAIIVSRSGGYMGIGFAIPSNMLRNVKEQLIDRGSVTRGFLGVKMQPIDQDLADVFGLKKVEGVLVSEVVKDSPAASAGIKQGDIITHINKRKVETPLGLRNEIMLLKPGTKITLTLNRNGSALHVPLTLAMHGQTTYSPGETSSTVLGVTVSNLVREEIERHGLRADEKGVVILSVFPDSPAQRAGLRKGAVIMAVDHKEIANVSEFDNAVRDARSKERILLLVKQGTVVRFCSLKTKK
ncbi:MAG: Do family serine endopeptidase [Simkaniaceae bacterium]|nr:Do family serine endopeptidase [Simkaniaceae bacterium]